MTDVETGNSVWDALAGRAPGEPLGPADPTMWGTVADRLDPARARPALRAGIEATSLISVRGTPYVMLRSPDDDGADPGYLRLTHEEWQLALVMDGTQTVARLVAEFARLAGRLAPDQVRRVVADLAANRMLDELPAEAFREQPSRQTPRRHAITFPADRFASALHKVGRIFFSKAAVLVLVVLGVAGLGLFAATWWRGSQPLFLTGGSYLLGAVVLLLLHVLAVAGHELGHALAVKHVGREVTRAGISFRWVIPAVVVDTADAWMAGRRARVLVTAAGPGAALILAGTVQLAALALPALGPVAFKFAFLCYLNVFLHLNPFLPLDGSRLLMDWFEIPGLRGRGLAWLSARLRGRPPAWGRLDGEGRTIALYGFLAVLWVAIAVNLAYRLWADRLAGVATGLWHGGPGERLLLVAIVLVLGAPLIVLGLRRLARAARRARQRAAERRRAADLSRRLAALRRSDLGGLPDEALEILAGRARWLRPPSGTPMVLAGADQQAVHVVVEGAMQARRPGDPGGLVRRHVGPGGVVGLADALAGRAPSLDWHTAGTTLLALPTSAVAGVIGPLPGPPPAERAEAEELFSDTPALAGLAGDERLALIASAHPVNLPPGAPVILPGPTHAVVVESGVIAMADGTELRRGTLIGPVGDGNPGVVAQTRTPTRLWVVPDAVELPPLVGDPAHAHGGGVPVAGVAYPPLAAPPGPPDGTESPDTDRRFQRHMTSLVLLGLPVALLVTVVNFAPGPAWAEMATDRAILTADSGTVAATVDGAEVRLAPGERRYVGPGARIRVPAGAAGRLTFPGGSDVVLCPGASTDVGSLGTDGARDRIPRGTLALRGGRVVADTAGSSGAYEPLVLTVTGAGAPVTNNGAARYAVDPEGASIAEGRVYVDGTPTMANVSTVSCLDGTPAAPPASAPPSDVPASPEAPEAPEPSVPPSASPSPSESPEPTDEAPATTAPAEDADPDPRPTRTATSRPVFPRPDPTRTTTPPPANEPEPTRTTDPPPPSPSVPAPDPSTSDASKPAESSASTEGVLPIF